MIYKFILDDNIEKLLRETGLFLSLSFNGCNKLGKTYRFTEKSTFYRSSLELFDIYQIGGYSYSWSIPSLYFKIGNYCSLARGIIVFGGTHPYERFTTSTITYHKFPFTYNENIEIVINPHTYRQKTLHIENDVYIGQNAILAPSVTLGTGCVVAAGALVSKDVPPYAIVGGNPAKIIKYRFDDKIIEQLLETHWTEYDITPMKIRGDIPIENFIEEFYNYRDKGLIKPIVLKNLKEVLDRNGIEYQQA